MMAPSAGMAVAAKGTSDPVLSGPNVLQPAQVTLTVAALAVALVPHFPRMPVPFSLLLLAVLAWRLAAAWQGSKPISRWIRLTLTVIALAAVWVLFGNFLGRSGGAALLCAMLCLKLLETWRRRDAFVVLILCYFALTAGFLFNQALLWSIYGLLAAVLVTVGLFSLEETAPRIWSPSRLRRAGVLTLQALPLALVAFVFYPRLAEPIWGLPEDDVGRTGLSGEMSPGDIVELFIDDSPAFRVRFQSTPPNQADLYWRGPVLSDFNGRTWSADWATSRTPSSDIPASAPVAHRYEMTLEPTDRRWLLLLDRPVVLPEDARMSVDMQVYRRRAITSITSYQAGSTPGYTPPSRIPLTSAQVNTDLPEGYNSQARELATGWRNQAGDDARAIANLALDYLRENPFYYTLAPQALGRDSVDDFLFKTREGYCEHFASAFTFLMRAAGVPARVVTGYQGGEYNDLGDYYLVRQSDAHAWAEVRLDNLEWLRVDPTAVIPPERVMGGLGGSLPSSRRAAASDWLSRTARAWDNVQANWNELVVEFNAQRQNASLERLGLDAAGSQQAMLTMVGIIGALLALFGLWQIRPQRSRNAVLRQWRRFQRKLARRGLTPGPPGEGPLRLKQRAEDQFPQARPQIARIYSLFVNLRYRSDQSASTSGLKQAVSALNLRRPQQSN